MTTTKAQTSITMTGDETNIYDHGVSAGARYVPISASEVPGAVRFHVPGRNQGQIVEVAYGTFGRGEAGPGDPYKRVTDRGDASVTYYRLARAAGR